MPFHTPNFFIFFLAFLLGLRHGIDWDHIAAITDITGSEEVKRKSFVLGMFYILGHASVTIILGLSAVLIGIKLPDWVDRVMEPFVGITLIFLGIYLIFSIIRTGKSFRFKSRWMMLFNLVHKIIHFIKEKFGHHHEHKPLSYPEKYRHHTAFTIGLIHGIGAETPTQLLLFVTAAGVGGSVVGSMLVLLFVLGLVTSNSAISILAIGGYAKAQTSGRFKIALGIITAAFSLIVGILFLFNKSSLLPAILGG